MRCSQHLAVFQVSLSELYPERIWLPVILRWVTPAGQNLGCFVQCTVSLFTSVPGLAELGFVALSKLFKLMLLASSLTYGVLSVLALALGPGSLGPWYSYSRLFGQPSPGSSADRKDVQLQSHGNCPFQVPTPRCITLRLNTPRCLAL